MTLVEQRAHKNAQAARVYLQDNGLYYAWVRGRDGIAQGAADIPDLLQAREIADSYAHSDCDGSCPYWTQTAETTSPD